MQRLMKLLKKLRHPEHGCKWDLSQTYETFRENPLREATEIVHAIDSGDMDNLCEEIGDTLFNLLFLVNMAEEDGHFTLEDVIARVEEKMIHRHPHVFGTEKAASADEALKLFTRRKKMEKDKGASDPP